MTKQQLKDYEKVQSTILLAMWINDGTPDSVPESELLKLPLEYAISDIDSLADNLSAELPDYDYSDDKYYVEVAEKLKKAKWFLRKYRRLAK